jgi:hypothetical protein
VNHLGRLETTVYKKEYKHIQHPQNNKVPNNQSYQITNKKP